MRDLTWFGWTLIGLWVFSALYTVGTVGSQPPLRTPRAAVFGVVVSGAMVLGLLTVGANR